MRSELLPREPDESAETKMARSSSSQALPRRVLLGLPLLGMPLSLAGCNTETLLDATFDTEPLGGPPAAAQPTGTVSAFTDAGLIAVAASRTPTSTDHCVRMANTGGAPSRALTSLQCNFARFAGDGEYTIAMTLGIPYACRLSLQLEAFRQSIFSSFNFLRIDFASGRVRINGETTPFGTLTGELLHVFSLFITMTIAPSGATARLSLVGEASGSHDVTVEPRLLGLARQFGALKFFLEHDSLGPVYIQGATVLRTIP